MRLGNDLLAATEGVATTRCLAATAPGAAGQTAWSRALDFSRVVVDSSSIRAVGAGKKLDRTQPIAVVRAASTTSLRTRKAFR